MHLRTFALLLATFATSALPAQTSPSQPNTFDLHVSGKPVGRDIYTLAKTSRGFKLTSHLTGSIYNNDINYNDIFNFTDNYGYVDGSQTSQATNQQTSYLPGKSYKDMSIAVSVDGKISSTVEPIGPNLVLLPPFDAGAAQVLLLLAVTHPTPDNLYNVYLTPGYSLRRSSGGRRGAPPPSDAPAPDPDQTLPPGVHMFKAIWIKGGDLTGTLNQSPVTVHTYALAFGKFRWIFFADAGNNLMQVNVSALHGAYIRQGFRLDPISPPR